jgi:hypothetical protein
LSTLVAADALTADAQGSEPQGSEPKEREPKASDPQVREHQGSDLQASELKAFHLQASEPKEREPRPLLSVIVPLGPAETGLGPLAADLLLLPADSEILLVCCPQSAALRRRQLPSGLRQHPRLRWLEAPAGRAHQLNAGAQAARGQHLWFVHVDSGLSPWVVNQLLAAVSQRPEALHYFRLAFAPDGRGPMVLNALGAHWRSEWLGVPFGDQGFCLSATLFRQLGGYDATLPYGEDHLLLWKARRAAIPLNYCHAVITTSARKYRHRGWGVLTLNYQWRWLRQAVPQAVALLFGR